MTLLQLWCCRLNIGKPESYAITQQTNMIIAKQFATGAGDQRKHRASAFSHWNRTFTDSEIRSEAYA
jgi:hypothetical protein